MDAGAVDAQEDPVGDAGPARVLGAAVEARLKRRQRDGPAEAAALPLLHLPPQPGGPVPRGPAALPGPSPRPGSPLPGRPVAAARPGAQRGPAAAQAVAAGKQPGSEERKASRRRPATLFAGAARSRLKRVWISVLLGSAAMISPSQTPLRRRVPAGPNRRRGRAAVRVPPRPAPARARVPAAASPHPPRRHDSGAAPPFTASTDRRSLRGCSPGGGPGVPTFPGLRGGPGALNGRFGSGPLLGALRYARHHPVPSCGLQGVTASSSAKPFPSLNVNGDISPPETPPSALAAHGVPSAPSRRRHAAKELSGALLTDRLTD